MGPTFLAVVKKQQALFSIAKENLKNLVMLSVKGKSQQWDNQHRRGGVHRGSLQQAGAQR